MGIHIRQADLHADRNGLIAALREHLNPKTDEARFRWLFEQNPHGVARIWVAVDDGTGSIVGSSALLPRRFYVKGELQLGCVMADTWIHPDHRYLGPAVALQRACLEPVRTGEFAIAYDLPQRSMIAVYRRLRYAVADELVTFEKVVRVDRFLTGRVGLRPLARAIAVPVNVLLAMTERPSVRRGLTLEAGPAACGADFDDLAERTAGDFGVCVARTSDYLNWRFLMHFHNRYELIAMRRRGRLVGYVVLLDDPASDQLNVIDLLLEPDPAFWQAMISGMVRLCRDRCRSVLALSLPASDARVAEPAFARFRPRRRLPWVLLSPADVNLDDARGAQGFAFFTYGDEAD